ncbi:DNA-deoxyinosine glycosylase [Aurantiacibacter gilvus]|uniref:DNA-deoxyinosine glycosylase n=1 Tax=Aurantiacibacter gilvus TaxID=3139141 RepID=A0ABU9IB21_9SPHN
MSLRKTSFPPAVSSNARILLLGSLPGERSLAERQYYAHPQNRFWHLVGKVIGHDLAALDYPDRLDTLQEHGIGLWDVVASARRDGSLDASIREAEHNPLADLAARLPYLRAVGFNGRTAEKIGRALLAEATVPQVALPSSSPAYAAMPLPEKERCWLQLRDYLETTGARDH